MTWERCITEVRLQATAVAGRDRKPPWVAGTGSCGPPGLWLLQKGCVVKPRSSSQLAVLGASMGLILSCHFFKNVVTFLWVFLKNHFIFNYVYVGRGYVCTHE